jgi:hypothetical protein
MTGTVFPTGGSNVIYLIKTLIVEAGREIFRLVRNDLISVSCPIRREILDVMKTH